MHGQGYFTYCSIIKRAGVFYEALVGDEKSVVYPNFDNASAMV